MDGSSFDRFTRQFAHQGSRRWFLTRLGLFGGAVAGGAVLDEASAARRPAPAPRPISCPGRQFWDGSACACEDGFTRCGPDCCPDGQAECCDNACCYGSCWGEELCCPTGRIVCENACRDWECCVDNDCPQGEACNAETHTCGCQPVCNGLTCVDGCGGTCACGEGRTCLSNGSCAVPCSDNSECQQLGCLGCWQTSAGNFCGNDDPEIDTGCNNDSDNCPPGWVCSGSTWCVPIC